MRAWKSHEHIEVIFDESQKHRLKLTCTWNEDLPDCLYIMLNPSSIELDKCDHTIDRCIKIAEFNGYGSISIVNLFSLRTAKTEELLGAEIRSIPQNLWTIKKSIDKAHIVVAAWGSKGGWFNANYPILKYLEETGKKAHLLDANSFGCPMHPSFIKTMTYFKEYQFHEKIGLSS
ncbi:DUF1643 domain-containing protein [Rummeliibacillus stabekisii]|uniref:DUF1643 domain-containing protein n=1 Tax=Rummeliibacillus stabekisii TaxID=241244 RepID=A0A143H8M3_9BACL|nr:DUF1643 domain-containing protein [Rummeliibacillus stabekisii]AMW98058.1 hypothetical protein ATY39_00680 [Rummeliibacillus stabekisii]